MLVHFLSAATVLAFGLAQVPQEPAKPVPFLSVSGASEIKVEPDLAMIRLGVVSQAKTAQGAQNDMNKKTNAFLDKLRPMIAKGGTVETGRIALYPVYSERPRQPDEPYQPEIIGYRADNSLVVRLTDFALVGPVIDQAVMSGLNTVESVSFGLRDDSDARKLALQEAVKKGLAKAQVMADAAGVELAGIWELSEGMARIMPYEARAMSADAGMAPTPVIPGMVNVNADVSIRFFIRQKR